MKRPKKLSLRHTAPFGKDFDLIMEGKIPWNYKDFCKVAKWYHEVREKPKDDWDLKQRSILLKDKKRTCKLVINSFVPENQLAFYMIKEFGTDGFRKYFFRFLEMGNFIAKYRDALEKDKMSVKGSEADLVKSELITALCLLPLSKIIAGKSKKDIRHEFDYNEVINKARELENENDNK